MNTIVAIIDNIFTKKKHEKYVICDSDFSIYAINIIPGTLASVVIAMVSPANILYMSFFFIPIALNIPISFILDRKDERIIKKISINDIASIIAETIMLVFMLSLFCLK